MEQEECIKKPRRGGTKARDWSMGVKCIDCTRVMFDRKESGDGRCARCGPCRRHAMRKFRFENRKPCPKCKTLIDKYMDACGQCRKQLKPERKRSLCACGRGKMIGRDICGKCREKERNKERMRQRTADILMARGAILRPIPPERPSQSTGPSEPPREAREFPVLAANIEVDTAPGSFRAWAHDAGGYTYRPNTLRQKPGGVR